MFTSANFIPIAACPPLRRAGTCPPPRAFGPLHGLMRVRCFTQDDAHIFMTPEQIKDEIIVAYKLIDKVYSTFGLNYTVELTRPENSIGTDEAWSKRPTD